MKRILANFLPSMWRKKALDRYLKTPGGRKAAVATISSQHIRAAEVLRAPKFLTSAMKARVALANFLSGILDKQAGRKIALDLFMAKPKAMSALAKRMAGDSQFLSTLCSDKAFLQALCKQGRVFDFWVEQVASRKIALDLFMAKPKAMSALAKRMAGDSQFLSTLCSDKAFLQALCKQGRVFDFWVEQVAKNPEATYRIVSNPEFVSRLTAQTDLLLSLAAQMDDPETYQIFSKAVGVAKAMQAMKPYLAESHIENSGASITSKHTDFKSYLNSIAPNNVIEMDKGSFKFLDVRGFTTVVDEIFVNEEYYCDLGEDAYVIDAGANVGLASFYIKSKFPSAKVIALEPVPYLADLVRRNVAACKLDDVDVREQAISASGGDLELIIDNKNSLAGSLTTRQLSKSDDIERIVVPTVTLADLLDRPVDFLKLDIEGVEFDAIKGAGDRLKKVHYFFCEYHADQPENRDRLGQLLQHLSEHGFAYHISKSSWAEKRYGSRPLSHAHRGVSYGIYAVNTNWPLGPTEQ